MWKQMVQPQGTSKCLNDQENKTAVKLPLENLYSHHNTQPIIPRPRHYECHVVFIIEKS